MHEFVTARGAVEGQTTSSWNGAKDTAILRVSSLVVINVPTRDLGTIQVSGDVSTHPSLRPNPNPKSAPTQTLGLREGRVATSQEPGLTKSSFVSWLANYNNKRNVGKQQVSLFYHFVLRSYCF